MPTRSSRSRSARSPASRRSPSAASRSPAIRIQIDPAKLVAKGLQLEDVRAQIAITTVDSPKGSIDGTTRSFTIYANDQLPKPRTGTTSSSPIATAAPLRVRDIGQAVAGPEDTKQAAWAERQARRVPGRLQAAGRQRHRHGRQDQGAAAAPQASIPPTIKVCVLSDRTQTIRASVQDVQFTLLLTIALVVMVIFVFLRSLWATIIPSVTVPLALLGACALMWVVGYSLDNLSLMALTISVGFVVDDAIVMLENITRHIEEGDEAVSRRRLRARARSASPSSRSAFRWSPC